MGRQIKRIDLRDDESVENTTRWFFDNQRQGIGQVTRVEDDKGYSMDYVYDHFGRNHRSLMKVPGLDQVFESSQTYDQFGRVFQSFDASSNQESNGVRGVQTIYNKYGFVSETRDARSFGSDSSIKHDNFYNKTLTTDARGNVTSYMLCLLYTSDAADE